MILNKKDAFIINLKKILLSSYHIFIFSILSKISWPKQQNISLIQSIKKIK